MVPCVEKASFIAPSASVSGDTVIGENSSIGYGGTIRGTDVYFQMSLFLGDVAPIRIGCNTHLRDNVVVHVDSPPNQIPSIIGNNCYIGSFGVVVITIR